MRCGELFAGIGGFGLAAERCGIETVWASEIDPFAQRVYESHFPFVRQIGDITKWRDSDTRFGPYGDDAVDIVTAGFPCQDLSVAGKRKGLKGERSGLFFEIIRVAERLRPRWLLIENVPGLRTSPVGANGRDLAIVLSALDELRYGLAWASLDAEYAGLAQRRERVFIVGCLGAPCPAEILFEPEGVSGDSPPSRTAGEGVAGSLGGGSGRRGWADDTDRMTFVATFDPRNVTSKANRTRFAEGPAQTLHEQGLSVAPTLRVGGRDRGAGDSHDNTPWTLQNTGHGWWNESPTAQAVRTPDGGGSMEANIVARVRPRRLTPRECERLQGFPDDWTLIEGASDSARYRCLGNAVAVPVVEWILRRLVAVA